MFYAPDILTTKLLPEDESQHAVRVMRLSEGDRLDVVDGRGTLYHCHIAMAHPKRCAVAIDSSTAMPPHWGHSITVGIAPTKQMERLEWAVEKMVEVGVDRIVPLLGEHSERRVLKLERLERIIIAAMKQSLKGVKPRLDELTPVEKLLAQPTAGERFIAYCDTSLPREQRRSLATSHIAGSDVTILIGPEGDFSPAEVEAAFAAGYQPVTLGDSRLRTETAAVAAVMTIHAVDQLKPPMHND